MSMWQEHSVRVINEVTREVGKDDLDALEKAIRAAYPFGERAHHPYKVWNREVKQHMWWLRMRSKNPSEQLTAREAPLFEGIK